MGIRAKLILSTTIPLLIIYVLVLAWDYWNSRESALEQIDQLVAQRASADASQLNGRLLAIQGIADRAAYSLAGRIASEAGRAGASANGQATQPFRPAIIDAGPPERGGPPDGGRFFEGGRPPDAPPDGGRGPGFPTSGPNNRFGGNGGERSFGRGMIDALTQSPWINAVWFRYDPNVARTARTPEAFGIRRSNSDVRPFNDFTPAAAHGAAWYERPMREGRAMWLDPDTVHDAGVGPVCIFSTPFFANQESTPAGVVCISIPAEALKLLREDTPVQSQLRRILAGPAASQPATEVAAPPTLAKGGYLLLDRTGKIISRPDGKAAGGLLAVGPDADALRDAIDRANDGKGAIISAGGLDQTLGEMAPRERYVLAMEQLNSTGWLFVTAQAEATLLGPVQNRLINRGLFLAGTLGLLMGVMTLVLTRFCRPIERMAESVHDLASGKLDIEPVPVLANDELGELARGFNDMTGRLRHHIRELTEQGVEREKVEGELRIARQIQSDLLPRDFPPFPERQEFSLHAVNIPARHIAGDFFDYFFVGEDRLTVVIADVSGKGVPAALMMAVTRTMVRNLAEANLTPCEIVERVNHMLLTDTKPGLFVTMFLGQYEPATGLLTYVNAGHPPAICICGDTIQTCCDPTGPLLGVAPAGELGAYEQATITFAPGAAVLLYTDGVTEAHDDTNVMFGEAALIERVRALRGEDTPDLCEGVVSAVMAHQHQSVADDLTLVALRRR